MTARGQLLATLAAQILGATVSRLPGASAVDTEPLIKQAVDCAEELLEEVEFRETGRRPNPNYTSI